MRIDRKPLSHKRRNNYYVRYDPPTKCWKVYRWTLVRTDRKRLIKRYMLVGAYPKNYFASAISAAHFMACTEAKKGFLF